MPPSITSRRSRNSSSPRLRPEASLSEGRNIVALVSMINSLIRGFSNYDARIGTPSRESTMSRRGTTWREPERASRLSRASASFRGRATSIPG